MTGPSATPAVPARAPRDLPRLVGAKLGNYRLERLVGRGRMGAVYLATDEALLRPTAVKVLSWCFAEAQGQSSVQWFLAEARLVARINHPRVVQIYGAARQGEHCYIAMEYVPGDSAEALVARDGPMSAARATDVLVQAAAALEAAHRSGVVHRDVKPANLLVSADGVTKLGDFGMALGCAGAPIGDAHVRAGTPYFMAPELWRGEAATPASDLYALGATYHQLLTGRPPFQGSDVAQVEQGHLRAPVPDPRQRVPGLPEACAALALRLLAKGPRDRPASAGELLLEAESTLRELERPRRAGESRPSGGDRERAPGAAPAVEPDPGAARIAPAVPGPLAAFFRFTARPFRGVGPAAAPYGAEPFSTVQDELATALDDDVTTVVALTGLPGSGRTTIARRVALQLAPSRPVLFVDARTAAGRPGLLQRIASEMGGPGAASGGGWTAAALADRLADELRRAGKPPLVVIDGVAAADLVADDLRSLLGAVAARRCCKVLLVGPPALGRDLPGGGVDPSAPLELAVPALDRDQVARYVQAWIAATRGADQPPILITPDALLLLRMRSRGVVGRVGVLVENMLLLAAAEGRRALASWHAFAASPAERWCDTRAPSALPRRPPDWPTPEAVEVIDACRRDAGMPPWPRLETSTR